MNRKTSAFLQGFLFFTLLQIILLTTVYANTFKPAIKSSSDNQTISDITSWHHPVKKVFETYGIILRSIELINKIATFNIIMPFDPQSSENEHRLNKLCIELLEANGWRNYSLRIVDDKIQINVSWNKLKRQMSLDIVLLKQE